ncbi:vesicle transport protein GOT1B isoform X1 [Apteryx rowi]|uniref:vesicle transport protein GOT1B isoform X1 n=1 Tax=Apteryx rowi TaxID=308060 RepID=UPI000E1DC310|nr:vesicle transport protein GOT1B isoform X1 [Apteryx rowi]
MGLTGFGVFFLFFGMILFFDKALLAIGNVLFVAGLAFVIGLERTFRFFFQKHKMKATGFFLGGVLIVLIGWPLIGMILEIYGFFLLFRGFFPVVVGFIRRVPVLGYLLNLPGISSSSCTIWIMFSPIERLLNVKGTKGNLCRSCPCFSAVKQKGLVIWKTGGLVLASLLALACRQSWRKQQHGIMTRRQKTDSKLIVLFIKSF